MSIDKTLLSDKEKQWILTQRLTRLSDQKEILIYPMGAERYLSTRLIGKKPNRYHIRADIEGKDVLVIPGYGNSSFLFAEAGAKSIVVYDKDPVTIAWVKAFKKYYHYREFNAQGCPYPSVGELLTKLTRKYPQLVMLPSAKWLNRMAWLANPQGLRRSYIFYMIFLVQQAVRENVSHEFELKKNIRFYAGELEHLINSKDKLVFDTAYVPYLLGVKNGIEDEHEIVHFIRELQKLVPQGKILVTPSRNKKEFYFCGQRYFITTGHADLTAIPLLNDLIGEGDKKWYAPQGLAELRVPRLS